MKERTNENNIRLKELFEAVQNNDPEKVAEIAKKYPDIINEFYGPMTVLAHAAKLGHANCLLALIDAGANLNRQFQEGTPLHNATRNNHEDCVKILIERGADLNSIYFDETPLMCSLIGSHYNPSIFAMLLKAGADVNTYSNMSPLAVAAFYHRKNELETLINAGANIQPEDKSSDRFYKGYTNPLIIAVERGFLDGMKTLINAGADVNLADYDHRCPLTVAARNGFIDGVKTLIEAGADVNRADNNSKCPLIFAVEGNENNKGPHIDCMLELLKNPNCIVPDYKDFKDEKLKEKIVAYIDKLPDGEEKKMLCEMALNKASPLGNIMWAKRGRTEPSLDSGMLRKINDIYLDMYKSMKKKANNHPFFATHQNHDKDENVIEKVNKPSKR